MNLDDLARGVQGNDLASLGRALTLVESERAEDIERAGRLLNRLLERPGDSMRVGISGVPGVGKSTLIDSLGMKILETGRRLAVLSVDPSSGRSGGSILGDKTRMARLSRDHRAFIRPSPNRGALGGVTRTTRESIIVLEAAGFDFVIVETVGVGQAELEVARMVDTFVLLMLPNAGDELQGIKRGVLEHAHLVVINKADGDMRDAAELSRQRYASALRLFRPLGPEWTTEVRTVSGLQGEGVDELLERVLAHQAALDREGARQERRAEQAVDWMWSSVENEVLRHMRADPGVHERAVQLERDVRVGRTTPMLAARELLAAYLG